MLARAESVAVVGLEGYPVDVEVSIAPGLPAFTIVGLPDLSVQEARERVRSAIQNSRQEWPQKRITVNLSPAHLPKAGSGFDLAIAVGILAASGVIREERLRRTALLGELSLDGTVRRVRGALAAALAARAHGRRAVLVPRDNAAEAALVDGIDVLPVDHLAETVGFLRGQRAIDAAVPAGSRRRTGDAGVDLADVRGQEVAKTALEVAAAGGHNMLMIGPPGGGKTMLARRLPTILPALTLDEALDVTRIYSVAGLLDEGAGLVRQRPFRAPHHSVSTAGLVGGGSGLPQPGEVSLAHRGVMFLDEATEFRRDALEALRGPIEDGAVTIVRSRFAVTYPARFQLIAAANPCPCGYRGDTSRECRCLPGRVAAHDERLSGPIMDRLDIQIRVERLERHEIFAGPGAETSAVVRERVERARLMQTDRLKPFGLTCNAEITARLLDAACVRTAAARTALERYVDSQRLTARSAHRMLKVARTIADLDGADVVGASQVDEAAQLRLG